MSEHDPTSENQAPTADRDDTSAATEDTSAATDDTSAETEDTSGRWWVSLLLALMLLGGAAALSYFTFMTEPTAERGGATKRTAMLVDVTPVERGTFRPRIVAMGTVEPSRDIELRPQVDGRVTALDPAFTPGGVVEEDALLLQIEAADYEYVLAQRKSDLRQALADLTLEKGRQDAAQVEYDYVEEPLSPENEALVLREPQLEAARERVSAARAAVRQARLDVERTTVTAPFDAHILRRDVNVGSQVSPSDSLGRLVGTDTYWIRVELPLSKLRWVRFPDDGEDDEGDGVSEDAGDGEDDERGERGERGDGGESSQDAETEGSIVQVRNRQSWAEGAQREGRLYKLVGALDDTTRMARVLAEVPDPLAREPANAGKPGLIIGAFVEVTIDGTPLEDVVRLPRKYVRADDTTWVMENGELSVRTLEIVTRDDSYAYVAEGLEDGDEIVTTNLSTVVDGAPLRLEGEDGQRGGGTKDDEGAGE